MLKGEAVEAMGAVNSFQSMGAVDGPGLRYVVFMQGCPLRCVYCHNPDTWRFGGSGVREYGVEEVCEKILRFRPYFEAGESGSSIVSGGVTVSGGEPLMQWEFVLELFRRLKEEGIHTALDTSGIGGNFRGVRELLKYTDLVLCDLKFSSEEDYRRYSGGSLEEVLSFLKLTEEQKVPLWIRHVVVPGLTDGKESLSRIARLAGQFSNLEKIELLPFRKFCSAKYDAMNIPFPLANSPECTSGMIERLYREVEGLRK
ncbi:MAG TPA: pyruvate formate-lyase-activating protein [Bacillota bacterium]|nr:pyruvate formate-lyase-activating protein [Bacillota bacterium]